MWVPGDLCGTCTGRKFVWCPDCAGFADEMDPCPTCGPTGVLPCPTCSGGMREPLRRWW